ncbi:MAG: GNAT family N-acetyltransferase [Bacteroidia bacterium]|nr:GNAT family N-acetyltransferase [Bacteroidia bacterium]
MKEKSYRIIQPLTEQEWAAYFGLRYEILRKPWNQPESSTTDESEDISVHFLCLDHNDNPAATGRLQINPGNEGQIRSMAVRQDLQRSGLGTFVLNALEKEAMNRGLSKIVLDAREYAVPFYLKNGYKKTRSSYVLFGVIPHFRMEKEVI